MSDANVCELQLSGVLSVADVPQLKQTLEQSIAEHSGDQIKIDLSGLESVSGAILSLLLCCMRAAEKQGSAVSMVGFSQRLYDMARVGGLETVLPISNS